MLTRSEPPVQGLEDFGTLDASGDAARTFDERVGRCYELAGYAVVFGDAPEGSRVVHGSWHGPGAARRIGHAWVHIDSDVVWEPIRMRLYEREAFYEWTRAEIEREYTAEQARLEMLRSGHFGRWHESRHP